MQRPWGRSVPGVSDEQRWVSVAGRESGSQVEGARVREDHLGPVGHCWNFGLFSEGFEKPLESLGQRSGMI